MIKKPIDLEKIGQKVKASHYENVEELLADIVLMFDNACRYNEPDSQIYKVLNLYLFQEEPLKTYVGFTGRTYFATSSIANQNSTV